MIVTRDGLEMAELQPLRRRSRRTEQLILSRRHLPRVDVKALRADLDKILDADL